MKNDTRSNAPDASYVNGKAYAGRAPEQRKVQKRTAPVAKEARRASDKTAERISEQHTSRAENTYRSSESAHHSSSHHHSHGSYRRKKNSALKRFFKNYGATAIALVGVVIIVAVIVVLSLKNKESATGENGQEQGQDTYVPSNSDYTIASDLAELTDAEAKNPATLPVSSKYFEDGKPDVVIKRDENGAVTGAVYYSYLEGGALISEKEYDSNGLLMTKTVYVASEAGCNKSVFTVNRGKSSAFEGYTLDEIDPAGIAKKRTEYTLTGVVDHYSYLEYNDKGQLSRETVYSAFDMLTMYYEYLYDAEGRKIEQLQYDANYSPEGKYTWEYDELGRVTKDSYFIGEVCRGYNEYKYRDDGSYSMTAYTLIDEATMTYDKKVMS